MNSWIFKIFHVFQSIAGVIFFDVQIVPFLASEYLSGWLLLTVSLLPSMSKHPRLTLAETVIQEEEKPSLLGLYNRQLLKEGQNSGLSGVSQRRLSSGSLARLCL